MIKSFLIGLAIVLAVVIGFGSWSTPAHAVDLNLKAVWNPSPEPDVGGYKIYKTDANNTNWQMWNGGAWGGPIVGTIETTTSGTLLPTSPQQLLFVVSASSPVTGFFDFALSAVDTNLNHSTKAMFRYLYNLDSEPPAAPTGFTVTKQ